MRQKVIKWLTFFLTIILSWTFLTEVLNSCVMSKKVTVTMDRADDINALYQTFQKKQTSIQNLTVENTNYNEIQLTSMKDYFSTIYQVLRMEKAYPSKIKCTIGEMYKTYSFKYSLVHPRVVNILNELSKTDETLGELYQEENETLSYQGTNILAQNLSLDYMMPYFALNTFKKDFTFPQLYLESYQQDYEKSLLEANKVGDLILKGSTKNETE